jgi:hypothetical protein
MMYYRVFLTILPLAIGVLGQSVSGEASGGAPTTTYRNPVIADNLADPSVIRVKGLYYLYGPGHGCAIQDPNGQWCFVYHQKASPRKAWDRFICLDPLHFDAEGRLHGQATRGR